MVPYSKRDQEVAGCGRLDISDELYSIDSHACGRWRYVNHTQQERCYRLWFDYRLNPSRPGGGETGRETEREPEGQRRGGRKRNKREAS